MLSFNSLLGSFIDPRTRRVAGAQWACAQENRKKKNRNKENAKVKGLKMRGGENYQVASPSEFFFVDLNGRLILIRRSHCYEAEWLVRKREFSCIFGGGRRGEEDRGVEGPRGGTH